MFDLASEIHELIQSAVDDDRIVSANVICQEIFRRRPYPGEGEHKDFYITLAWDSARAQVRKAVNRWKAKPEDDQQLVLPGYSYLQRAYTVEREDGPTVVPLNRLTSKEILDRVTELRRMADGCLKHAEELMGYYSRKPEFAAA